jgi:hypothetical protein
MGHLRARITLEAPPDHEEGRSGAPSKAGGRIAAGLLTIEWADPEGDPETQSSTWW